MSCSQYLLLFVTVCVCAMVTLGFAEAANITCNRLFVDLQKPNGNCEKPVHSSQYVDRKCQERIRLSWLQSPPFISKTNKEDPQPVGIFVDLLLSSLSVCCRLEGSDPPSISYDARPADSLESLFMKMYNQETDIILPVNTNPGRYEESGFKSSEVLFSPGDALLISKSRQYEQKQSAAWRSLVEVVPILLLSVLLAAIAGICIWALDTKWNSRDFPRPFFKGASEGFWWAFVTMTTVGYGDRTPKSVIARTFGICWIVASLAICSIMTASITAVLTTINVDKDVDIVNKDLAVLKDSASIVNAVKNDANPKLFNDFDSMYDALNKGLVDGILMEMYGASYAISKKDDDNLQLGKLYPNPRHIGFVEAKYPVFDSTVRDCLRMVFNSRENDVFMIVNRFIQDAKKTSKSKRSMQHDIVSLVNFDSPGMVIIIACFLLLSLCGVLDQTYRTRRQTKAISKEFELEEPKKVDPELLE